MTVYRDIELRESTSKTPHERRSDRPESREPFLKNEREAILETQRTAYEIGGRSYRLNDREARMLTDVGKFRVIEKNALVKHIYEGCEATLNRDLTHLRRQGLVRIVSFPDKDLTRFVVLTKPARQLAERYLRTNPEQQLYSGAKKFREMKHDAAVYRVYAKAIQDIQKRGGRPQRVLLDFEIKKRINRELVKSQRLPKSEQQARVREIAQAEGLKVVHGKIPIPDIRIEYETAEGERAVCDLEYVTENYKAEVVAQKKAAGFQLYGDNYRGRKTYGPDVMGEILSL